MDFEAGNQNLIGIFTTDAEFVVQVWDAALEKMTGISAETVRGKSIVETIPNLETRGLLARFRRVLNDGTVEILSPAFHRFLIPCPPQFASKHFTEMRQRTTIAPLKENDEIRGLIVSIEDVTGRMERELELAAQLKNSDESVRLQTAKTISDRPGHLGEETAAPLINALGDKNWRVRRELVESLSRRAAPDAITALLRAVQEQHFDFGVLNSALQVLQATSVKTTETLIEFLRGDDADLRMQAALALGEQKDSQAVPALLEMLRDEDTNVRYHAIEALGKLRSRESVGPLLDIAESGDFFLSFAALDSLRQIADESITNRIRPLLSEQYLREAVIETLGTVGSEEIVPTLIDLLNDDSSAAPAVAKSLGVLFDRYEKDFAKGSTIIEKARVIITADGQANLLEALSSAGQSDLVSVIRVAGWLADEKISEKLVALLENETIREAAAQVLAQSANSAAVDLLIERLASDDSDLRHTIIRLLGELKDNRATLPLIEILENDSAAAPAAALALGHIADARALEPLIELLETAGGDAASRQAAVAALKSLAHPDTVSRLCDLLGAESANVRESAVRVVGHFGSTGCEEAILECCEDTDERVRRAAIEQLSNIGNERAVSTLICILKHDPASRVREAAAKALASVKSDKALTALREALGDADPWTRYFSIRALGSLHDMESRELLIKMAEKDPAEQVRLAAGEVLSKLKA